MGFRSTFCTQGRQINYPEWFVEKYKDFMHFGEYICSSAEYKTYGVFAALEEDIQKCLKDDEKVYLVWLHECGGITKAMIKPDSIVLLEPDGWLKVDNIMHNYCYGCSDKWQEIGIDERKL